MKYFIASDIHGSAYYCEKMLEAYNIQKKVKEQHDARPIIVISYITALSRVCGL